MSSNIKNATAIFGGSFNPPTLAHLSVIEGISRRFERVIVVPTAISPFKTGATVIPGSDRIALIRQMTAHLQNVVVSDYEVQKKGVSYTYLTLQHFSKLYDNLYFVLGTDNISQLGGWRNMDVISSLSTLYFVPRPYYSVTAKDNESLAKAKCRYEIADFVGEEGSSSLVSVAVAFSNLSDVLDKQTADFITSRRLYEEYCYITDKYAQFNLKPTRIQHIYRTTKSALILASKNGVNPSKAIRAAMLHDVGKYVTIEQLESSGASFPSEAYDSPEPVRHCYTSEYIARQIYGETDEDVLNAIKYHTTGRKGMSDLECVVFCADYVEEGRRFDGIEQIRAQVYNNLKKGMLEITKHNLSYLQTKDATIDKRTLECKEWLLNTIGEQNHAD